MIKKNKILLFLGVFFCSIILTPSVGGLYNEYITPISNWFWGPNHPEYIIGFILSFLLFGSFFSWLFIKNQKKKFLLYYTLPFLLFLILFGAYEELIVGMGLVFLGWLLAQGVLLVRDQKKRSH